MPLKRPELITGDFYHVYNRGVEKRDIFTDDAERARFVLGLYEFNDAAHVWNLGRYYEQHDGDLTPIIRKRERDELVDVIAFALMKNHYHLLLREKQDGGISAFMQKQGAGFTRYFNERHDRVGALFQGVYRVKHVPADALLEYMLVYLHLNPLGLSARRVPKTKVPGAADARKRLASYRWSSYHDYVGRETYPEVLNLAIAHELRLPMGAAHEKMIADWVEHYV